MTDEKTTEQLTQELDWAEEIHFRARDAEQLARAEAELAEASAAWEKATGQRYIHVRVRRALTFAEQRFADAVRMRDFQGDGSRMEPAQKELQRAIAEWEQVSGERHVPEAERKLAVKAVVDVDPAVIAARAALENADATKTYPTLTDAQRKQAIVDTVNDIYSHGSTPASRKTLALALRASESGDWSVVAKSYVRRFQRDLEFARREVLVTNVSIAEDTARRAAEAARVWLD